MPKQLALQFSEVFPSNIWETALCNGLLLISCRNNDQMQADFSLLDLATGEFRWKSLTFDESWWLSIFAFQDNVIVFQVFNDSQNIEARSVFGFDIISQEALWSVEDIHIVGLSGYALRLKGQEEEDEIFTIDIRSGEEVEGSTKDLSAFNMSEQVHLPLHYTGDSSYFPTVVSFLRRFAGIEATGACDYLEHSGLIFIAAHEKLEQNLTNWLFVFNEEGNCLLKEILAKSTDRLASDTFYIVNERLIFVKEKSEVKSYLIKDL